MKLFLVRHGETDWLLQGRLQGRSGVCLNETGEKQSRTAAEYLRTIRSGRLFVSELERAKETARYISEACVLRSEVDTRLNEIFFGEWEGRTYDDIRSQYPEHFQNWVELKSDFSAPGGENVREVSRRIRSFYDELAGFDSGRCPGLARGGIWSSTCPGSHAPGRWRRSKAEPSLDETVIAVSHGGPIRLLLLDLLNEPLCKFRSLPVEPGSVTLIEQGMQDLKIVKIDVATGAETCLRSVLRGEFLDAG